MLNYFILPFLKKIVKDIIVIKIMKKYPQSIIYITHEFYPKKGGIAVYTDELALASQVQDITTQVWVPQNKILNCHFAPYSIHRLYLKGTQDWFCRYNLMKELRGYYNYTSNNCVTLIDPGPILTTMYINFIKYLNFKNLIVILHGTEIKQFGRKNHWRSLFARILERSNRIGVVSEYNYHELINKYRRVKEKVVIVPGALRHFFKKKQFNQKNKINKSNKFCRIISVGRIHPRKGQLAILEAIELLPYEIQKKIEYTVIGSIVNSGYYQKIIQKSNQLLSNISFKNNVNDSQLPFIYKNSDIFSMTSMPYKDSVEGFGLVYLEAGFFGLPIIAHACGGVSNAVIHKKTGFLVNPYDRTTLSLMIKKLVINPALRQYFGNNARKHVNKFSWKRNTELLFENLEQSH